MGVIIDLEKYKSDRTAPSDFRDPCAEYLREINEMIAEHNRSLQTPSSTNYTGPRKGRDIL